MLQVDDVQYTDDFVTHVTGLAPSKILLLSGLNTDSGNTAQPGS